MSIDLAAAYVRTGLTKDPANDGALTMYLNVSLAVLENYLDRKFLFDSQEDRFYLTHDQTFQLSRYPIENIAGRVVNGGVHHVDHKIHHETGTVMFKGAQVDEEIVFRYTGGYRVLPADLELAFWLVFDNVYGTAQGGAAVSVGDIQSISVPDVGTVRFSTGGSAASQDSGSTEVTHIPDMALSLIQPYRRKAA